MQAYSVAIHPSLKRVSVAYESDKGRNPDLVLNWHPFGNYMVRLYRLTHAYNAMVEVTNTWSGTWKEASRNSLLSRLEEAGRTLRLCSDLVYVCLCELSSAYAQMTHFDVSSSFLDPFAGRLIEVRGALALLRFDLSMLPHGGNSRAFMPKAYA